MTVTTALYRRYRPDSFADVIGQEHVTEPLMTALRKNRVNHAYLFSGPRGCGKTTSARILARCLNCAQGPTDTPCGTCPSCVELARGGSGSLDVIEIDAASHGGVDDARDLRERATFAPVRDRYKIFIIDEAHMVTSAGFNALLKIVEEPPEHIKFIFATTEPDKVIGTIRSRTHHYPFRLVPPEPLMAYLELLCQQENVPVAPGVLSLVIRAGGGSVRDSLSVLDQLMAGAGPNGLDYELAVALLGYTHASLLDDVVEAVAASDAATVFRAVDRVIQTGHDPRRFVEDLLERFRDLIIVQAMPESAHVILRGMPADQIARLQNQAHNLGAAELSRAADVTNTALTEMTGATSPRLHLELLCARILLPSAEQNERGMAARIDRVERRLNYAGNDVGAPALSPNQAQATQAPSPQPVQQAAGPLPAAGPVQQEGRAAVTPEQQLPGRTSNARPDSNARPESRSEIHRSETSGAENPPVAAAPAPLDAQGAQAPAGLRTPLTPPRVSTNDWPVDETAAGHAPTAERSAAPAAPHAPADGPQVPETPPRQAPAPETQPRQATDRHTPAPETRDRETPAPETRERETPAPATQAHGSPATVNPQAQDGHREQPAGSAPAAPSAMGDVEVLRRAWPDVLQTLSKIKRSTWALVEPNAQVSSFDGSVLTLSFTTQGLAGAFGRADHSENLRQAIHKTVGIDCQINAVAGGASQSNGPSQTNGASQPGGAGQQRGAGQSSSDPNPKAPASPVVPATSADVAWGLAPAPSAMDTPRRPGTGPDAGVQDLGTQPGGDRSFGEQAGSAAASGRPGHPEARAHAGAPGGGPRGSGSSAAAPAPAEATTAVHAAASQAATSQAATSAHAAPSIQAAPANPPASHTPAAPATANAGTSSPASSPAHAGGSPPGDASSAAQPAPAAAYPDAGGDYSYSDDDWGPARDEDAPPLDEEPPMDWEPSPRPGSRATPPNAARETPQQSAGGAKDSVEAPSHGAGITTGTRGAGGTGQPAAHDPWTRAVEQAPGVWVVGDKSNVGAAVPAAGQPESSGPVQIPRYEPATAQVPPSIPVTAPAAASGTGWASPGQPTAASADGTQGSRPPSTSQPAPAPEFAMASAGSAPAVAPIRPATPGSAPAATRTETRQSLYQRLSNSPEAAAGRAKAPSSTAASTAYVQDIPSADDETIEESGVFGRAAVERILGGKLIEERSLDGSPVPPRY
nr:DNA polymerase III subunit gamma and tau [Arthrobacter sp. MAHUQ-56]